MDADCLIVDNVTKRYRDFKLDGVSFAVPRGTIVGLVGENGAGKSTTIKAALGLIKKDGGSVTMLGRRDEGIDNTVRDGIGVVFDGSSLPEGLTPLQFGTVFSNIYPSWNKHEYRSLLKKLDLPEGKKVKEFSKGMKMKLACAIALSHSPGLLVLDEATTGLDPVVRDEVLDMFLEFARKGGSILVSSHITSDLEKIADRIVLIHRGRVVFDESVENLTERYGIAKCPRSRLGELDRVGVAASKCVGRTCEALLTDRRLARAEFPDIEIERATIDEVILLYVKGEPR